MRIGTRNRGRPYFINDQEQRTFREFISSAASLENLSVDKLRSMPCGLAFLVGRMMGTVWTLRGGTEDPPL